MFESQLMREWTAEACRQTELATQRKLLLLLLKLRFPEPVPEEFVGLINRQESGELLQDWFLAGIGAASLEEFLAVLRRWRARLPQAQRPGPPDLTISPTQFPVCLGEFP
jgi:hypothetical protein